MKDLRRCLIAVGCLIALALSTGCRREPFKYVKASGKITYEDGTLIPAEGNFVRLWFYPDAPPLDPKTHPRPGAADINLADGTFDFVTTHRYRDGLTIGKSKVIISTDSREGIPKGVLPEYNDLSKTPLEVDTDHLPILLKIKKPK